MQQKQNAAETQELCGDQPIKCMQYALWRRDLLDFGPNCHHWTRSSDFHRLCLGATKGRAAWVRLRRILRSTHCQPATQEASAHSFAPERHVPSAKRPRVACRTLCTAAAEVAVVTVVAAAAAAVAAAWAQ
eukprot:6214614-Pleurochrysis_carterae.AAC.1